MVWDSIPIQLAKENKNFFFGQMKKGARSSEFEIAIQKGKNIVPIEVKAESNIRSQSLKAYCEKYHPVEAVRFSSLKFRDQD